MTHIFMHTCTNVFVFDLIVTFICTWCAGHRKQGHERNIVVGITFTCRILISVIMALLVAMTAAGD